MLLEKNKPLRDYTTLKIGGRAKLFFEPRSVEELLRELPHLAKENRIFVLGGGSNTVFGTFVDKCVVSTARLSWIKPLKEDRFGITFEVGGGTPLIKLLKISIKENLGGLEGLFGIPRITVGGAVAMNAGAYGFEIGQTVESVEYLNLKTFEVIEDEKPRFGYRSSPYRGKGLIVKVHLRLKKVDYPVGDRIGELLLKRRKKQPLSLPSAGSTFKNPPGDFAGRLIEAVGLKGYCTEGGLCFSRLHANFAVNLSKRATFEDFVELTTLAKERVSKTFGVELEEEVTVVV